MTARIVRIEVLAIAALAIASACSDESKHLLAPQAPDKMILQPIDPGGIILRPRLPDPNAFSDIFAGGNHTCARKYGGDVLCWGRDGEAGYEKITKTPTLAFSGASQIAVGIAHACAINSAGAATCWGGGQEGQLGIQLGAQIGYGSGAVLGPKDPNSYYGTLAPIAFNSIYAGGNSTCGLAAAGVYCWGAEGDYTHPGFMSIPFLVVTPNNYSYAGFSQLAVGYNHICGYIGFAQQALCWGSDNAAQAGADPASAFYFPGTSYVMFAGNTNLPAGVQRIAAGTEFNCADIAGGTVQCFGRSSDGQLGAAPGSFSATPVTVSGATGLHGVVTGSRHACALDANSEAWCWGYNYWGMVGNGTWSYSTSSAQKVAGVSTGYQTFGATVKFRALAAGAEHTCGISTDNHIYCWGHNNYRQLGTWLVGANGQALPDGSGWVPAPVLVM
jgi:alpha-tubulin suppressor-like RCC1 family protein